ncbi:tbc1 domain family member 20 [Stylonychia lemnae]|uniref:Tbc1 domain family member 20 n=1 Tax=Stylonychia lemnae TaxID=5949 RepID=A0A078AE09_STYLE|nr:tbc1 domain family member 20 [Stylonychia lemnae]|eukprot:CDW79148.1 tbc1 domain family member 20 [Stylonychia lemnae]
MGQIDSLKQECLSKYGLLDNENRLKAWPLLLNANILVDDNGVSQNESLISSRTTIDSNRSFKPTEKIKSLKQEIDWAKFIKPHRDSDQIDKDIKRSLNTYDICKSYEKSNKDYMLKTFEEGIIPLLTLLMKLLEELDQDIYDMVEQGVMGQPTFTLSWILTWFSHDIDKFTDVQRIYDACLASHPLYVVYMAVAVILMNKQSIDEEFDYDDPMVSIQIVFQNIAKKSSDFNVETIIQQANKLIIKMPPEKFINSQSSKLKQDSPFIKYQLDQYYQQNNLLKNSMPKKEAGIIKNVNQLFYSTAIWVTFFAVTVYSMSSQKPQ